MTKFIESKLFSKLIYKYLLEKEYIKFRNFLAVNPKIGKIIKSTGGFRKTGWQNPKQNKGKRSGIRIIYYYFADKKEILLFSIYAKNEITDLTAKTKKMMKQFIIELKNEI